MNGYNKLQSNEMLHCLENYIILENKQINKMLIFQFNAKYTS